MKEVLWIDTSFGSINADRIIVKNNSSFFDDNLYKDLDDAWEECSFFKAYYLIQMITIKLYLMISASVNFGSCLSIKHAKISSQWKEPLCVPIFILSCLCFLFSGSSPALMNAWAEITT